MIVERRTHLDGQRAWLAPGRSLGLPGQGDIEQRDRKGNKRGKPQYLHCQLLLVMQVAATV